MADDFAPWRNFVRSILQTQENLQVVGEASNGEEAIQKAEALRPEVILLDISMPGLNGIKVARRLSRVVPKPIIVLVSQERSFDIAREALGADAQGYVIKADAESELLTAIKAVVQGKQFLSSGLED